MSSLMREDCIILTSATYREWYYASCNSKGNFEGFTKKQVKGAINVQRLQAMLGHPSKKDYESLVCAKHFDNTPVTQKIYLMLRSFLAKLAGLSGKTVQKSQSK